MPLADKIIELRKKQGWSQIDLADRLDVSRQSVSKWEMAQAVPELDKIIKMSELFAVTTDYLLKDEPAPEGSPSDAPPPPPTEEPPQNGPAPEPEAPLPAEKKPRKKWPWILAAAVVLVMALNWALIAAGVLAYRVEPTPPPLLEEELPQPSPTPAPNMAEEAVTDTVTEEPVQEAVAGPAAPEDGMTEYVYEGETVTADGFDEAALEAMKEEYAPYGITCEDGRWYYEGRPIRVFTDVLTSNGESIAGGHFQGTMRNFAGEGDIDVRTVRDYDHCDEHGNGTLLYIETCDIHGGAHWEEHHAEEEHH